MKKEIFTIAGGNATALVYDCPASALSITVQTLLNDVEQVGFVVEEEPPRLKMMGDELCVNGILALAYNQNFSKGNISASGVKNQIQYQNNEQGTHIVLELPYTQIDNIILFEGIGFICIDSVLEVEKKDLVSLSHKYNMPAFGSVACVGSNIHPVIYVVKTDSLVKETACGSGSIAAHLVTGIQHIEQPTGEVIFIERNDNTFCVQATVVRI